VNWYIVTGIIFVALGTFLMTYGGIFQTRGDSKRSETRLDEISRDLADLRGKPKSDLRKDAIARVERDVQKWAKEFASEEQKKRLIVEQKRSDHDTSLEHSNKLAREYFGFFVAVLRDALTSYSATKGHPIKTDLPEVSDTLFSDPDKPYQGTISFTPTSTWKIRTYTDPQSDSFAPPAIEMVLLKNGPTSNSPEQKGTLRLRFTLDLKSYWLQLRQDFLVAVPMETGVKPTTDYEENIRSILISLIEFQLLQG
jgi:hypothetical protein